MNLHGIIGKYVGAINPQVMLTILRSTGTYSVDSAGHRKPLYTKTTTRGQIQAVSSDNLLLMEQMNIQGYHQNFWINGSVKSAARGDGKGGDTIVSPDGRAWKVTHVSEIWPDWTSGVVTLQTVGLSDLAGQIVR